MAICVVNGCSKVADAARGACWKHYKRWQRYGEYRDVILPPHDTSPTPHDQLTYAGWMATAIPLPPLELIHNDYRATYAMQNERDGYLTDPQYLAAVQQWKSAPLEIAAD